MLGSYSQQYAGLRYALCLTVTSVIDVGGKPVRRLRPDHRHPKILGLYQSGDLTLDEIITPTYRLDQVNEGYDDLLNGKNVRGVIVHEH
jgi:Zn-dependent alcohol dehydrogenase